MREVFSIFLWRLVGRRKFSAYFPRHIKTHTKIVWQKNKLNKGNLLKCLLNYDSRLRSVCWIKNSVIFFSSSTIIWLNLWTRWEHGQRTPAKLIERYFILSIQFFFLIAFKQNVFYITMIWIMCLHCNFSTASLKCVPIKCKNAVVLTRQSISIHLCSSYVICVQ